MNISSRWPATVWRVNGSPADCAEACITWNRAARDTLRPGGSSLAGRST
jgi:hypothetical protein